MTGYLTSLTKILGRTAFLSILVICGLLLYDVGWFIPLDQQAILRWFYYGALGIYLLCVLNLMWTDRKKIYSRRQLIIQSLLTIAILFLVYKQDSIFHLRLNFSLREISVLLTVILIANPLLGSLSRWVGWVMGGGKKALPPALLFLVTLTILAIIGSMLLMMPNCTYESGVRYIDSLFISVSAVCVTGLGTVNLHETFTPLGHFVILLLIQMGGFGIMTFAYFVAMVLGKGFSLKDKVLIKDLLNEDNIQSTTSFLRGIILFTFVVEAMGALSLWFSWQEITPSLPRDTPLLWYACFHSISAFCNAGFSNLPNGLTTDFIVNNKMGQGVIMTLISIGGLGYAIFKEIGHHFAKRFGKKKKLLNHRWTTYFILALFISMAVDLIGALCLFASFMIQGGETGQWYDVLWLSLFNTVTSRTAGFNIGDIGHYPATAVLIMCGVMMIGGSPGGTAGGVRTTTFAVVLGEIWRILKERRDVEFNGRRIDRNVVERCIAVVVISMAWVGTSTIISCFFEPGMAPLDLFFENVSAFSTTGLTRGITPDLLPQTKILLMINMIAGRIGIFFFLIALVGRPSPRAFRYPNTQLPLN